MNKKKEEKEIKKTVNDMAAKMQKLQQQKHELEDELGEKHDFGLEDLDTSLKHEPVISNTKSTRFKNGGEFQYSGSILIIIAKLLRCMFCLKSQLILFMLYLTHGWF